MLRIIVVRYRAVCDSRTRIVVSLSKGSLRYDFEVVFTVKNARSLIPWLNRRGTYHKKYLVLAKFQEV